MATDTTIGSRLLTAYFDQHDDATRALNSLLAIGIPKADVTLSGGDTATTAAAPKEKGFWSSLVDMVMPEEDEKAYSEGLRRGGYVISARVEAAHYERALDILDDEGTIAIEEREKTWRSEGWTGSTEAGAGRSTTTAAAAGTRAAGDPDSIKVAEEQLRVGKRDVNHGRVRVRSYIVEEPVREDVTLRQERVDIERRSVDRPADASDELFKERTIEVEEHSEEAVVAKDVRVTEELVVTKDIGERTQEISDTVRKTKVEVEDERGTSTGTAPRAKKS